MEKNTQKTQPESKQTAGEQPKSTQTTGKQPEPQQADTATGGLLQRQPGFDPDLSTDIRNVLLMQNPRGGQLILWLIALLFVAFVVWAANSEIDEVTRGTGKVIPSQQIQVVQNMEGGILGRMHVKVGDVVDKDQLLLDIDKTRFTAPYMESKVQELSLKAQIARLEAEISGKQFVVPEEVAQERPEIGEREVELYTSKQNGHEAKMQILQEQYNQRRQEVAELRTKVGELGRSLGLLQKELNMTQPLVSAGAVSEVEVLQLRRQASQLRGELETSRTSIPRAESRISEAKKALEEEKLNFQKAARQELNEAYVKLEGISANKTALVDRLQRTEVRSPVHGIINQIKMHTVGGTIQPGMDLVEIVPLDDTLLIEAQITPADIAFLHPNQQATVKFTAYDFTIYGGLDADLEHISADSITDEKGNAFYLVRLRTKQNHLGSKENQLPIIPGMVASVDILTGKKTILSYLLKPILRAKHTALRER